MGCFGSKNNLPDQDHSLDGKAVLVLDPVVDESTALLQDYNGALMKDSQPAPSANLLLLDYAQRMAEEIVALAVRQWDELDRQFRDIPYIDSDLSSDS